MMSPLSIILGRRCLLQMYCQGTHALVGPEVALDIAIHHVHITLEKKLEFQRTIQDDPLLCTLAETIVAGWPEDIKDVPKALHPYHNHHDVMTLITPQVHLGTQGVMAKLKLQSRLQKVSSPMPNTQGRIPTLPCWHTGAHPSMLTFVHQLRCSTREQ